MNSIEKKLRTDGKNFNPIPSDEIHDKILQNLSNQTVNHHRSIPKPLTWLLPITIAVLLVTIISLTRNTPTNSAILTVQNKNLELKKGNLDQLVTNVENKVTSEIENEQMAILNDIKQFNNMFML
jgi:signal transduction histidine kinase